MTTEEIKDLFLKSTDIQLDYQDNYNFIFKDVETYYSNYTFIIDADFIFLDSCIEVLYSFDIQLFIDNKQFQGSEEITLTKEQKKELELLLVEKLTY